MQHVKVRSGYKGPSDEASRPRRSLTSDQALTQSRLVDALKR
jgi:hypothetical protein